MEFMCNNCNCENYEQCSIVGYMPVGFCCPNCAVYDEIYTCYKAQHPSLVSEKKEEPKNILAMISRPVRVTKKEITISKEKKVCLVCKEKISGIIYMCPECEVFYCLRCSNTLSNVENACWVCNTPFDDQKLLLKEEEKELEPISTSIKDGILKVEIGLKDKKKEMLIDLQKQLGSQ